MKHVGLDGLDALLISKRENITYLTGLKCLHPKNREALLLITSKNQTLYHSIFLTPPKGVEHLAMDKDHPPSTFFPQVNRLGFEANDYTVSEYNRLQTLLPSTQLIPTFDKIETLRLIKDEREQKLMAKSAKISNKLMSWITHSLNRLIDQSIDEITLSHQIESHAHTLGADSLAFPTIVAFGKNTAEPHHQSDHTPLSHGPVLIDLGVNYQGYASDMTRTIWFGDSPPPPQFTKIKDVVHQAYDAAVNLIFSNFPESRILTAANLLRGDQKRQRLDSSDGDSILAKDLDLAARQVIEKAGFGTEFIHTTGHGLGLEIHEQPSINSQNLMELKPGMAITIEPGIYLPDLFGYRFENTLIIN
jgi:Xaa-Pro aminopeptidase